nr:MAG TPA: hypothetical protein [Caudoviricetes sp.]
MTVRYHSLAVKSGSYGIAFAKKSIETVPYNTLFKNTLLRWGIFCADVC